MRLEQLTYFVTVLECGSFRRATEELHLSQPALSEAIKNLERELGAQLMDRDRSGVRLTQVGEDVLPHIRAVLAAQAALTAEVDDHRGLRRGQVRIGAVNAATNYILGPVINGFHTSHPDVQLRVTESGSLDITSSIKTGKFDVGLVVESDSLPIDRNVLDGHVLLESPIVACVPQGHHLLERDSVRPADIASEPHILFRSGYFMSGLMQQILGERDLNVVYYTNNTESAKRMIAAGIGITLLPRFSVIPDLTSKLGEVNYLPLVGNYSRPRLTLVKRHRAYASPAVLELWSALTHQAEEANKALEAAGSAAS